MQSKFHHVILCSRHLISSLLENCSVLDLLTPVFPQRFLVLASLGYLLQVIFFCFLSRHMQPWQHNLNLVVHNILHHSMKLLLFFLECHSRFALEFWRTQCADRNSVLPYTLIWFGVWVEQAMGRGLAAPSNQVVHTHFAISENVGDVLAKEEVWTVAAELCGLALGVCILVKSVLQLFSSSPAYIGWTEIILKNFSTYEDKIALLHTTDQGFGLISGWNSYTWC